MQDVLYEGANYGQLCFATLIVIANDRLPIAECVCNWLGADRDAEEPCNRTTGQCPCLPNVKGEMCDTCAENHWKLASGVGCEACDCDPIGSLSQQCNEFDGMCTCIDTRGGRRCDQCPLLQWGDPTKDECKRKS